MKKVIVGLSGGVDSSVAAFLLKQQGYDVTGVTMAIWDGKPGTVSTGKHACYGPDEDEEIREARELAAILDIPYRVFDCSQQYKELVLDYFRKEYLSGRTPNPCVKCNHLIKFGMLPEAARREGIEFDYFATGHYAKVEKDPVSGRFSLIKGKDARKDQTYFIYRLTQDQLSHVLFPLGQMTKQEVRAIASRINIPLAEKEESQDFYSGDYKELLDVKEKAGEIVTAGGKVLGSHKGFWNYTIGQRKGLGVAFTEPLYVVALDKDENKVIVGTRDDLLTTSFLVRDLNWITIAGLTNPIEAEVKIRSAQDPVVATLEPVGPDSVKVVFRLPNGGITPGQSAVFYQGDVVLGGGVIEKIEKES